MHHFSSFVVLALAIAACRAAGEAAKATCVAPEDNRCYACFGACKRCKIGRQTYFCAGDCAGFHTFVNCDIMSYHATVVTSSVACPTDRLLCGVKGKSLHICAPATESTAGNCRGLDSKLEDVVCKDPQLHDTCAKCGQAMSNPCVITGSEGFKKGYLCTDAATCPIGTIARPPSGNCDGLENAKLVVASKDDCGEGTTTCMKGTDVYCVADPKAECGDYQLNNPPKCAVDATESETCSVCKGDGTNGCRACKIGKTDFLCASVCPPSLSSGSVTCTDEMLPSVEVTSALECTDADKKLCKVKATERYLCLTKPSATDCKEVDGGLLDAAVCTTPESQDACAKCGQAWCTTCALGADKNHIKGYLCTKEAKCPVGSVATTCTGLDKQVTLVSDGGKCDVTATTCTKDSAKYCIVGTTDGFCPEFGLDELKGTHGDGVSDCKDKACDDCIDDARCSMCKFETMTACIAKGSRCPQIANKTSILVGACDGITGTFVEGACEPPNHMCKKGGAEICIVEDCWIAGLDSSAAPPIMAGLVGLAITIVAMHC